ncbi:unnamed protein product [Schistosoma intercalatum]|nr:unnamed protein product [Schistosoma intercalatum]CAH8543630.1 unnamed protein product [Schistosoma intercalatum]
MSGVKAARPILSRNHAEARRRVISLYRACSVDLTVPVLYARLREEFRKNKDIKDLRIIDLLIHRWQNELIEVARLWKSDTHVMDFFREDHLPEKPKDFLDKFLSGKQ